MTVVDVTVPSRKTRRLIKAHWLRLARKSKYPIYGHLTTTHGWHDPLRIEKAVKRWLKVWHMESADHLGLLSEFPTVEFGRYKNATPGRKFRGPGINAYKNGPGHATYFIAIERSLSGMMHAHALINPTLLLPLDLYRGKRLWQGGSCERGMAMGDAKIEATRNQCRATRYTNKNDLLGEVTFLMSPGMHWPV